MRRKPFQGKKILITGHTGFKGAWLSLWLQELGATLIGYSLPPPTTPSLFDTLALEKDIQHHQGDILDKETLESVFAKEQPEIVFHLAAQAIVLDGYADPQSTFATNALGTVNVLEACRQTPSVRAIVSVTTDKCYDNKGWVWGYREEDRLGGKDPYSASKAMAELAIASYRDAFFQDNGPALASVRAGNVIGGGDFSRHRLLPDAMRALAQGKAIPIRNPGSVRPWLYVLDALNGYLHLAERLLSASGSSFAQPWNFGPQEAHTVTVQEIVHQAIRCWGKGTATHTDTPHNNGKEMPFLRLNWDKARHHLPWAPVYSWETAVNDTVDWHKAYPDSDMRQVSVDLLNRYTKETT